MKSLSELYKEYCEHISKQPPPRREFYIGVDMAKAFTKSFTAKQLRNFNGTFIGGTEAIKIIEDYIDERT